MEGLGLDPGFWKGKRVLITGHTGFKGSWMSEVLINLGASVAGFSLEPPTEPSLFEQLRLDERLDHTIGDIRELSRVQRCLRGFQPEIVFHMAAQSLVRQSYIDPVSTYSTNVLGTIHVLEACRNLDSVVAIVVVTSDKCYENQEWYWGYRENEPLGGLDPYSSSKACAELVTGAYRNSFFNATGDPAGGAETAPAVGIASVRAGNVIGGGDWSTDRLIPDAIRSFLASKPVAIRNPEAVRPWQHVLDPLRGYLMLAERLSARLPGFAEAWNFGPAYREARSVEWVVQRLCERWQARAEWFAATENQPFEATNLHLDSAKSNSRLQWWPTLGLEEALDLTCEWYVAYAQQKDVARLTQDQVLRYLRLSGVKETV
jgi:CDP-glucose 4,6-dehydratase